MTIQHNALRFSYARKGFTLIEIMISLAIIAALTVAAFTTINYYRGQINRSTARTTMQNIKQGIMMFQMDTGKYPEVLRDLVKRPEGLAKWQTKYLATDEVPLDPWGNKYQYRLTPGQKNPYELYSYGSSSGKATPKDQWIYAE